MVPHNSGHLTALESYAEVTLKQVFREKSFYQAVFFVFKLAYKERWPEFQVYIDIKAVADHLAWESRVWKEYDWEIIDNKERKEVWWQIYLKK